LGNLTVVFVNVGQADAILIVEEAIYKLIPGDKCRLLKEDERFLLLASAWLHDVGMILNLFGRHEDANVVRDTHDERCAQYIRNNRETLGLDLPESTIVAELCRYHRKKNDISTCQKEVGAVRLTLLAAYLRLADAIHLDITRMPQGRYDLLVAAGMPWESRFHWLRSMWVNSIIPDPERLTIKVDVFDTPQGSSKRGLWPRLVEDELQEELDSVRGVLVRGRISCFLDIDIRTIGFPLSDEAATIELEEMLGNIELEHLSSASEVANSIINTAIRLVDPIQGLNSYKMIREYARHLEGVFNARPCHVLIQTVIQIVRRATEEEDLPDPARKGRLDQIKADLESLKATRERNTSALADNAKPFLLDGGSIVVYGYSVIVLKALGNLPENVKKGIRVFVAECRGKTQYSIANKMIYCDGVNYAVSLRRLGFGQVTLVPDICIASLLARGQVSKVIFGANGIDAETGEFGHSAGHLAIADLANVYHVPVYVIADTAKLGRLQWDPDLERNIQWLTQDRKTLLLLREHGIGTVNPREDKVEPGKIAMLITEVGAFPPANIPESIRRRRSI